MEDRDNTEQITKKNESTSVTLFKPFETKCEVELFIYTNDVITNFIPIFQTDEMMADRQNVVRL